MSSFWKCLVVLLVAAAASGCAERGTVIGSGSGAGGPPQVAGKLEEPNAAVGGKVEAASPAPAHQEVAILAGGCFWGMEEILRTIPGVLHTEAGYTGGTTPNPRYEDLHDGDTGHAESVRITFDPSKLSYADLLERWFFRMHDPTTKNRQGNDVGTQYRSAIFVTSAEQRKTAEDVKRRVEASGAWRAPLTTEIADAGPFTLAEEEHQDYLQKHPGGYTCHYLRDLPL